MALSVTGQRHPEAVTYRVAACSTAPVATAAAFADKANIINQREESGKQLGAVAIREGAGGALNGMVALGDENVSPWVPMTAGTSITPATVAALAFTTNLSATASVATGAAISLPVVVTGGYAPYTYVWTKGGTVVAGQTGANFSKAAAVAGDAGVYQCTVTDLSGKVIKSVSCTLSIT
ncbi:Hoc-like head decoration [Klebsiella phage VLCpiA2a]|nr:Hoc-like head decoration [Klebsiella phage VLCpiA2a]